MGCLPVGSSAEMSALWSELGMTDPDTLSHGESWNAFAGCLAEMTLEERCVFFLSESLEETTNLGKTPA
jgi:hypothetical protein